MLPAVGKAREIGPPDAVITPPGVSVCPSIVNLEAESAVYVCPPTVISGGGGAAAGVGADIGVPDTVIVPPGVRVWPDMTNSDAAFAVIV